MYTKNEEKKKNKAAGLQGACVVLTTYRWMQCWRCTLSYSEMGPWFLYLPNSFDQAAVEVAKYTVLYLYILI